MGWIIFKGIHSSELELIITKLPPIMKPPYKYEVEKINGRSGGKIREYGYDVYEKQMEIFLDNPDRIDDVISYLSGSGELITSDEKDKYYIASVLEQVDYNRLAMYRTAKVVFLVQPFKYARNEEYTQSLEVYNQGNYMSEPIINITGNGQVNLSINGEKKCTLNISGSITLDSQNEIAYNGTIIQNRRMTGDFPILRPGLNTITYTGNVTKVETLVRSRWL